jgi:hypothetical protein
MGKLISKFVFMPPGRVGPIDMENEIPLLTEHGSKIQVKIIDRGCKFWLIISHGNAEDIGSVYEWANTILKENVNVNIAIYGKKNIYI